MGCVHRLAVELPYGFETCKAHSILKLSHQVACGTNKYQVGSEIVVVHGLVYVIARFPKSFVARF